MRRLLLSCLILSLAALACNLPGLPGVSPTVTVPADTATSLPSATTEASVTPSPSLTPTVSHTPEPSQTPTVTPTPGPSTTPTFTFPTVTVNQQAHCRYGPNVAYLHAADLYTGDTGSVRGRFQLSKWLLVKFDKLKYFCWVAPSVVNVSGDITTVRFADVLLPGPSVLYNPPRNVVLTRDGAKVHISWDVVPMTDDDDRGYFLDLMVCQGGAYLWWPVALANRDVTSYTVRDEAGCHAPSGGKLYAVEKHGYTRPVELKWPLP